MSSGNCFGARVASSSSASNIIATRRAPALALLALLSVPWQAFLL